MKRSRSDGGGTNTIADIPPARRSKTVVDRSQLRRQTDVPFGVWPVVGWIVILIASGVLRGG